MDTMHTTPSKCRTSQIISHLICLTLCYIRAKSGARGGPAIGGATQRASHPLTISLSLNWSILLDYIIILPGITQAARALGCNGSFIVLVARLNHGVPQREGRPIDTSDTNEICAPNGQRIN